MIFGFNTDIKFGTTVYHVQSEVREHDSLLQTQVFVKGRCLGKYATSFADHAGQPDFSEDALHELLKQQHKHFVECARAGTIENEIEHGRGIPGQAPRVELPPSPVPEQKASAPPPPPPDEKKEERIELSLSDDADLAAIAEASAAAAGVTAQAAPPPVPVKMEDIADQPAERPPDPILDSFMAELEAAEKAPPPPPIQQFRVEAAGSVIGKGVGLDCLEPIVAPDGNSLLLNVKVSDNENPASGAEITCRISMPNGPAAYVYSTSNSDGMADVRINTGGLNPSTGILIQANVRGKSASRKFTLKRA